MGMLSSMKGARVDDDYSYDSPIPTRLIVLLLILVFLVACWLEARQPVAVSRYDGTTVTVVEEGR